MISQAPVILIEKSFYVIGGYDTGKAIKAIAKIDDHGLWTKVGDLNEDRWGHGAILIGDNLMVFGEYGGTAHSEKCLISNDQVTCVSQPPSLTWYYEYPELFLVSASFCKD